MSHARAALVLALGAFVLSSACKKQEEPEPIPVTAGSAPTVVAADSAAAAAASAAAAATATTVVVPPPPPATTTVKKGENIDACCSALAAVERSGRDPKTKSKFRQASAICPGISALVKDGKTQRSSALTQVRASLVGVTVPSECN